METPGPRQELRKRYGVASSEGGRKYNEDSCAVRDYTSRRARRYLCFIAVADGMGGHHAGDVASQLAIDMLHSALDPKNFESERDFRERAEGTLCEAFSKINSRIFNLGGETGEGRRMGTTLTCAVVDSEGADIAHVGDTRAYLVTPAGCSQVTDDHSVVGRMVSDGVLTEAEARTHAQRNVITRAIGPEPTVEIDILHVPMQPGDFLVLCTDGLYTKVDRDEIARVVWSVPDAQGACERLVELAIARKTDDNASAVAWSMPALPAGGRHARAAGPGPRGARRRWLPVVLLALLAVAVGFGVVWGLAAAFTGTEKEPAAGDGNPVSSRPVDTGTKTVFSPGETAQVMESKPGNLVNLRESVNGADIPLLKDGLVLLVAGGPETDRENRDWYKVEVVDPDFTGTPRAGFVKAANLVRPQ